MRRARSGGSSLSPASVSTAARIAAIGVLSSWDTSETKRRRIVSVRSRSVTSRTTPTAAGSPAAVPCGTARTLTSSTCSGEVSPPRRRTAVSSDDVSPRMPAAKSRSVSGSRTRSTSACRGAPAGARRSASAAGFASRSARVRSTTRRPTGTCSKTVRARRRAFSLPSRSAATRRAKRASATKTSCVSSEPPAGGAGCRPAAASATPARTRSRSFA